MEELVVAREIECAVLGNDEPQASFRVSMSSTTKRLGFWITPRNIPAPVMCNSLSRRRYRKQ